MVITVAYLDKAAFEEWRRDLDVRARLRLDKALTKLERGDFADIRSMGDVKLLKDGIYEVRIHESPGYRVYFLREGDNILILRAGTKQSQKADIHAARQLKRHRKARLCKKRRR